MHIIGSKDLTQIKNNINPDEYYLFKDNNKSFILLKIIVPSYTLNSNKSIINLESQKYDSNNNLNLKLYINSNKNNKDAIYASSGLSIYTFITIKVEDNLSGLTVNGIKYNKFNGAIILNNNGKYEYINDNGNLVNKQQYDFLTELNQEVYNLETKTYEIADEYNNYLLALKDGKYGIIDKNGNILIDCKYTSILNHTKNIFFVNYFDEKTNTAKVGKIDINDNLLAGFIDGYLPTTENVTNYFTEIHSFVLDNKKGVVDSKLNIVDMPN